MPPSPTFSVITPVFNGGPYLERTIRSALRQSHSDFELILVDDGSTDGAVERLCRLEDPRLRVLRKQNEGAPAACNAGLAIARGPFIALLDHDDLWSPDKLTRHLQCFGEHPEVDLTFTWSSFIGADDEDLGLPVRRWRGRVTFEQLLVDNVIGCSSSVAIRRRAIDEVGEFDPQLPLMYDLDFYLRVLYARPASALAIPEILAFYRRHPAQMSHDWRALRTDWRKLLQKVRTLAQGRTSSLEIGAAVNMNRYFAYVAYESREFRQGWDLLAEGFRLDPRGFLIDSRNWKLTAAYLAGRLLPASVHRRLEALAGIRSALK
jgi:glycosyltransferase involved in cell wall biosynthesis